MGNAKKHYETNVAIAGISFRDGTDAFLYAVGFDDKTLVAHAPGLDMRMECRKAFDLDQFIEEQSKIFRGLLKEGKHSSVRISFQIVIPLELDLDCGQFYAVNFDGFSLGMKFRAKDYLGTFFTYHL